MDIAVNTFNQTDPPHALRLKKIQEKKKIIKQKAEAERKARGLQGGIVMEGLDKNQNLSSPFYKPALQLYSPEAILDRPKVQSMVK